jgi:DNA-binding NarL/FixJ family response regulator
MPIRILIADDHAIIRSGLKALLEKEADLQVVGEAGTGPETLRAVEKIPADVLVLDISMPGMPGPQVAETVVKQKPKLAIVVLTMFEDKYYLKEMLRIGASGFVLKKSSETGLVQAIRAAYRGDKYVDPALAGHLVSTYVGRPPKDEGQAGRLGILTAREKEVCSLLAYGHTNAQIAERLFISPRTVEMHRANIMSKVGLNSRAELIRFAIDNGLAKFT